jgi:protein TonB
VSGFRLPLALSLAAHAIMLVLLLLLPAPPPPETPPSAAGIEVGFAPALPAGAKTALKPEPPPPAGPPLSQPPSPPPPQPRPQPPPPPPPAAQEPAPVPTPARPPETAPAVAEAWPLPPPPKPLPPRRMAVRRVEKPAARAEPRQPAEAAIRPVPPVAAAPPARAPAAPPADGSRVAAPQPAAPFPSPGAVRGYEALLGEWLNTHKRYPESARAHGEQGRAVIRFSVARNGRVTAFAVVQSTGYADLDAALAAMMQNASLPPFPAGMPQPSISVSVAIRFSLER